MRRTEDGHDATRDEHEPRTRRSGPAGTPPAPGVHGVVLGLQRAAGNRAVAQHLVRVVPTGVAVQRKITESVAPELSTPAQVIKDGVGTNIGAQNLPGTAGGGTIGRPTKIVAEISKKTIRKDERQKSSVLAKITSLARAEQMLLQGADMKKFFDAGHLVGDQLIGTSEPSGSFEPKNLAPQVSAFNTPNYSAVEGDIRMAAAAGAKIRMEVALTYPGDYTLSTTDLVKRGVITAGPTTPKNLTFARRIPVTWSMHAISEAKPKSKATRTDPAQAEPRLGSPYVFHTQLYKAKYPDRATPLLLVDKDTWRVTARQWSPTSGMSREDAISVLANTFPDLGSPLEVAQKLAPTGMTVVSEKELQTIRLAAGSVSLKLLTLPQLLTQALDATELQGVIGVATPKIMSQLMLAQTAGTLVEAIGHLVTAESWVVDLHEELVALIEKQKKELIFPLSFRQKLDQEVHGWKDRWDLEERQYAPDQGDTSAMGIDEPALDQPRDLTKETRIDHIAATGSTGSFRWSFVFGFDPPVKPREVLVLPGNTIVRVTGVTSHGDASWTVFFKHPGS